MKDRTLKIGRRACGLLRRWWRNYLRPAVPFTPDVDLTVRPRDNSVAVRMSRQFGDLKSFMSGGAGTGVNTVWHHGLPIDMSLSANPGAPLIVVFHGAAAADVRLPWLSGTGVTGDLSSSRLSISDPSLYLSPELNLSWFSGSRIQPDLITALARIIKKTAAATGAPRVVLFGGSGGGFISLKLLEHLPQATAVVMNPQTDIEKYHEKHVQRYIDLAWKGDRDLLRSTVGTAVFDSVEVARDSAQVIYMQNANDFFHIKAHLTPFRERFGKTPGFLLLQDSWREGHTPPPKEIIRDTLAAAVAEDSEALRELGFTQL